MTDNRWLIEYPELAHPLAKEKRKQQISYLDSVAYLVYKYAEDENVANKKVESLARVILRHDEYKAKAGQIGRAHV